MNTRVDTRTTARVAGSLLLLLALAACGSGSSTGSSSAPPLSATTVAGAAPAATTSSSAADPTPSPSATPDAGGPSQKLADGRTRVTDTAIGYQLVLPRGYVQITSRKQLDEIMKKGASVLQGSAAQLIATEGSDKVKMFALNSLTGGTINLVTTSAPGATSDDLPAQAETFKSVLQQQLHLTGVTSRTITIDGATGLRLDGTLTGTNGRKALFTQLYAVHGDNVFIISIGGLVSMPAAMQAQFLASVHFLG